MAHCCWQQQSSSSCGSTHGAGAAPSRIGVDARKLLAEHKELDVGKLEVQALHLSQRGAYDEGGYYHASAEHARLQAVALVLTSLQGVCRHLTSVAIHSAPHLNNLAGTEHLHGLQDHP